MPLADTHTSSTAHSDTRENFPPLYKVLLHNDDYTTMDFVVAILMGVFGKSLETANELMLTIHRSGSAVCGIYPREIAETKVQSVHTLAEDKGFPLRSTMEKE